MTSAAERKAATLACWRGPVAPVPLGGGISNHNFLVEDRGRRFMVRIGEDFEVHNVLRRFELAASRAAEAAGISPAVVHAEPGAMVFAYVEGRTLAPGGRARPGHARPHRAAAARLPSGDPAAFPRPGADLLGVPGPARLRGAPARGPEPHGAGPAAPARRGRGLEKRSGRSTSCSATTICSRPT